MNAQVISKATGVVTHVPTDTIDLNAPSIVELDVARADVVAFDRQGADLLVRLTSGEQIRIVAFYPANATIPNDLVLRDPNGALWQARIAGGTPRFAPIDALDELNTATAAGGGSSLTIPAVLGGLVAAGGAAALAGGGAGGSGDDAPAAVDRQAPAAPTATISGSGAVVTGLGEAGATVEVRDAAGTMIGSGMVAADGSFAVPVPVQANGQQLTATQTDPAGNASPAATITAPDLTVPTAPTATIEAAGAVLTGRGEPGATVTIRDAVGTVLATAIVAADGGFSATLSTPQANGGTLSVVQADPAGNVSPTIVVAAPDTTAPAAPTATIDAAGAVLTGRGESGATVTVRDAAGTVLATATVAADGGFSAALATPQANGGTLSVVQADPAGNVSPAVVIAAPDTTAPAAPTATIAADGTAVSGTGESGARITVTDAAGTVLALATVAADGGYTVPLVPARTNGEMLSVGQADAAGNATLPLPLTAPDLTAPAAPVATLDATGTTVTGRGEAGAEVAVRDAAGTILGTATADGQGAYAVVLAAPQIDAQALAVVQTDAAGNVSPATPLTAPDLTAPAAPAATVATNGASVTGIGEPGATVTVRDPLGVAIGAAAVGADGVYTAVLATPQTDGQLLAVTQSDPAGNLSPPTAIPAPDFVVDTDPPAPTAIVAADGTAVTGIAIAGAAITLYDANGAVIGTGVAAADGAFSVALSPARTDGETVRVTQTEADGDVSPPATAVAPDLTAPPAPTAALDPTGGIVAGTAEAGATVTVRAPDGTVLGTAIAAASGDYAVVLTPAQANGGTIAVAQADASGNVSPSTTLAAPDVTAPAAPLATVGVDGSVVTGRGEAGATVVVRDATGAVLGSVPVAADGSFTVPLVPPQADGQTVSVTVTDPAGNVSPATDLLAPDLTAPLAPAAAVVEGGTALTGTGEPGATVTVTAVDGTVLGTATVAGDGGFTVPLATPQANGEALTVVQNDAAGNVSPALLLVAPDITAPAAPTLAIGDDGIQVAGIGEPGATVTITDPAGIAIGTALVGADGRYTAVLSTPQVDGERLTATQADAAGNVSGAATALAADVTSPAVPTATITVDGAIVSGLGEPGAIVTVTSAGVVIGTAAVAADGSYSVALTPVQANGEALTVVQADAAGNASPALPLAAPDITAPLAPIAVLDATGAIVTGTGEPGARVSVSDAAGTVLGTAIVTAQGVYAVALVPVQVDSQPLSVVQTDAAGNASPATGLTAPDLTAPLAPTGSVAADGATLAGTGEPGATVTVRDPLGLAIGTAVVGAEGAYVVALSPPQVDGELLSVVQADPAGNVSPTIAAPAPDLTVDTDPLAPTAAVGPDGTAVTGTAIAGATITVYDATGTVVATGTAGADGTYSVPLSPPRIDGETVRVTQTEADGDVSPPTVATAPDLTAPPAPVAALDPTGTVVTGTGEPGATVTVRAADGTPLGTAQVTAGGAYVVTLATAQANGEALAVTQADRAGNVSPATGLVSLDTTAPLAPAVVFAPDGTAIAGTGEAGTIVTVRDPAGVVIGSGPVGSDGSYVVPLLPPQANGGSVSVTLTDAAGNASPSVVAAAPDVTAPGAPSAIVADGGAAVTGIGEPGSTVSVSAGGVVIGSGIVAPGGGYVVVLTPPQANGEALTVSQADAAGNVSPTVGLTAPDTTAPDAPTATVAGGGTQVTGLGEPGATVTVTGPGGVAIGGAVVGLDGTYTVPLSVAQVNGETLIVTQADAAGNVSAPAPATAPDITAPTAPIDLAVAADGGALTGTGEAGTRVDVRDAGGAVIGSATVADDGSFTVALTPAQVGGDALAVTLADAAGNVSLPGIAVAPIDIAAFDNAANASIDLAPTIVPVALGNANYLALVSLGVLDLQAQVLAVPAVQFSVQAGHSLDAVFTYDAVVNLGVASGYSVIVQRLEGTQWVSVDGGTSASLLEVGLFNGNLSATDTLGPGQYRAFLTFQGAAGVGLLGSLAVSGLDADFTHVATAVPTLAQGNVITDPGVGGAIDVVGVGTHVTSVAVNGTVIPVAADGTVVDGAWGTLVIDLDGHYIYTPDAAADAVGHTDVFTYTLLDPTDGERESASLSITIGSPDVAGVPLAVADQGIAAVAYQNVVETIAPAVEFSFTTPGTLVVPQTGSGSDSFTVAADSTADVTITAVRGGTLALLPTYQLSVTDAAGAVVATLSQVALAGLPLGSGATFTLQDLPAGTYSYSVSSTNVAGTPYGTTVYVGETVTFLDRFTVSGTEAATGNILDNDTANTPFAAIRVETGSGFAEVGDTPVTLVGLHGTLTLDEAGSYTYQPSDTLGYSAVDLVDRFTYELVQPGGATSTATLSVTIDVPADGTAVATPLTLAAVDYDVVPLDALVAHDTEVAVAPAAAATGLAGYDLFERQGELENVLDHYLAMQPANAPVSEFPVHAAATIDAIDNSVVDLLDYLVMVPDQDHHAANINHVV